MKLTNITSFTENFYYNLYIRISRRESNSREIDFRINCIKSINVFLGNIIFSRFSNIIFYAEKYKIQSMN